MWGALKEHWKLNGRASLRKMKRKQFDPINHLLGPSWWWRMRKTKRGPLSFPAKPLFVISLMVDFGCRHGCLQANFKFCFTLKSPQVFATLKKYELPQRGFMLPAMWSETKSDYGRSSADSPRRPGLLGPRTQDRLPEVGKSRRVGISRPAIGSEGGAWRRLRSLHHGLCRLINRRWHFIAGPEKETQPEQDTL